MSVCLGALLSAWGPSAHAVAMRRRATGLALLLHLLLLLLEGGDGDGGAGGAEPGPDAAVIVVDGVLLTTAADAAEACERLIAAGQLQDAALLLPLLSMAAAGAQPRVDYCVGRLALSRRASAAAVSRLASACGGAAGAAAAAAACTALADAHLLEGAADAARGALRRALAAAPEHAPALLALGRLLAGAGEHRGAADALGAYWRAVPGWVDVVDKGDLLTALANAHVSLGEVAAAAAWLRRGAEHEPAAFALRRGVMLVAPTGDSPEEMAGWLRDVEAALEEAIALAAAGPPPPPARPLAGPSRVGGSFLYPAMFQLGSVARARALAARAYLAAFPALDGVSVGLACPRAPADGGRVVVGFLSRYFYHHPVGRTFARLVAQLPRADFEVVLFLFPQVPDDAVSRGMLRAADRVVWLPELGDLASIHRCLRARACCVAERRWWWW